MYHFIIPIPVNIILLLLDVEVIMPNTEIEKKIPYRESMLNLFNNKLTEAPPRGQGLHPWLFKMGNWGLSAGKSCNDVEQILTSVTAGHNIKAGEIKETLVSCKDEYDSNFTSGQQTSKPVDKKPSKEEKLSKCNELIKLNNPKGKVYTKDDLLSASLVNVKDMSGIEQRKALLHNIFDSEDKQVFCFCGGNYDKGTDFIKNISEQYSRDQEYFISNPLSGKEVTLPHKKTGKLETYTRRRDSDITKFNHVVLEHDSLSIEKQYTVCMILIKVGFSVKSITFSGSKSLHIILEIKCDSLEDWKSFIKEKLYKGFLIPLGFDSACSNPARLTRLAGHKRADKDGAVQQLLYLNSKVKPLTKVALNRLTSLLQPVKTIPFKKAKTEASDTVEIQSEFFSVYADKNSTSPKKYSLMAEVVLKYILKRGNLYYNLDDKAFNTSLYFDSKVSILLKISSDEFKGWLSEYIGINRADRSYDFIFKALETASLSDKKSTGIIPKRYWYSKGKNIYMSNGNGNLVRISPNSYELLPNGTDDILFEHGNTLKKWDLVSPENPFLKCSVFNGANYASDHGADLLSVLVIALPLNPKNKPPCVLTGAVGSGKTRTAQGTAELFGIPVRIIKMTDKENSEQNFWVALNTGGISIFDNVDTNLKWLPDALATASTGGSFSKRKNYTDSDEIQLQPNGWSFVTSANPSFASDAGLADRLYVIRLNRRKDKETEDSLLLQEILKYRDSGLSYICMILSKALADTSKIDLKLNKRHPDFGRFAYKIGKAMGKESEVKKALAEAELDKSKFSLENSEVGVGILNLMEQEEVFKGTPADLIKKIKDYDLDFDNTFWTPKKVGRAISKLESHLTELFKFSKTRSNGKNIVSIQQKVTQKGKNSVVSVVSNPFSDKPPYKKLYSSLPQNTPRNDTNDTVEENSEIWSDEDTDNLFGYSEDS